MERRLKILLEAAKEAEVEIKPWDASYKTTSLGSGGNLVMFLEDLGGQIRQYEERVVQMGTNQAELEGRLKELVQMHDVIAATSEFLQNVQDEDRTLTVLASTSGVRRRGPSDSSANTTLELPIDVEQGKAGGEPISSISFVTGVIERRRLAAFQRVLWRALRGNVIIKADEIPQRESAEAKSAFVAFVHGHETLNRVKKICQALGCALYTLDAGLERRQQMYDDNAAKIDDIEAILYNTRQAKKAELVKLADVLEMWQVAVLRQKHAYATLNKFSCDADVGTRRCYIAEGWCPKSSLGLIEQSLRDACIEAGLNMVPVLTVLDSFNKDLMPPTHFPTNKFTLAFQEMTDAYGVAAYGEANPAVYMIITFPFLFAVMFGDIGHGLIMALFGGWMVWSESRLKAQPENEAWNMAFGGRYVILLMGLFSIYTGFIYNDVFSKTISIFPSMFYFSPGKEVAQRVSPSYVYPFGLDPKWHGAENGMTFSNSYKMKQSILFGLFQMNFGIILAFTNMVHFGETIDIWCNFLPQLLFMMCLFGYLGILILVKWLTAADVSLLNLFITMVLRFGAVEGTPMYPGQQMIQTVLMVVAISCIPWMLFAKPVYQLLEKRKIRSLGYGNADEPARSSGESISSTARKAATQTEEQSFGDLMVHQVIHTIEFVLGSVSNTASYLRLWALSLAHAQLSEVLWDMTIGSSVTSMLMLPISFLMWLNFTLGIMVAMEGMSAFLHALRLHWVEFNNKFYRGTGVKFEPFVLRPDLLLTNALQQDDTK